MSEITILLLYVTAALAFACSCLLRFKARHRPFFLTAMITLVIGLSVHCNLLYDRILTGDGFNLSIGHVASMVGLELALIALLAATDSSLRGISAGLLLLGAVAAGLTGVGAAPGDTSALIWQARAHILVALLSYGLITVGAIVAIYAIVHDRRLRHGQLTSSTNCLFAPLETTERLLFGITAAGVAGLAVAITLGLTFVEDLFAQHLSHKSTLAILSLIVFGVLLLGRFIAGWRGARAVKLYLAGYILLCLAYFGSRIVLEQVLSRSWS